MDANSVVSFRLFAFLWAHMYHHVSPFHLHRFFQLGPARARSVILCFCETKPGAPYVLV